MNKIIKKVVESIIAEVVSNYYENICDFGYKDQDVFEEIKNDVYEKIKEEFPDKEERRVAFFGYTNTIKKQMKAIYEDEFPELFEEDEENE